MNSKFTIPILLFSLIVLFIPEQLSSQSIQPPAINGLTLWLKADSGVVLNGNNVSQWSDLSGNNNHCTAAGSAQPAFLSSVDLLNCKPAIKFNGTSNFLTGAPITGVDTSSLSIFVVVKGYQPVNNNGKVIFGIGSVSTGNWLYQGTAAGVLFLKNYNTQMSLPASGFPFTLVEAVKQYNVRWDFYKNGAVSGTPTTAAALTGPFTNGNYTIGNGSSAFLNAEVAEVIIYKAALNPVERSQIENYLFNRYAPPVSLGADTTSTYSFCPVVLNTGTCKKYTAHLWSNNSTADSLVVSQTGLYSVKTTDVFGRFSYDTVNVTLPPVLLNSGDTTLCYGHSANLSPLLGSFSNYSYLWQDNTTSSSTFSTAQQGNYFVKVTDTLGCFALSNSIAVLVDSFENQVSLGPDISVCAGNLISLATPSSGWPQLNFIWTGGSNSSSIPVSSTGDYSVTVTNSNGCIGKDTIHVNIAGSAPVVSFNSDTLCFGQVYTPINSSVSSDASPIVSYHWNFGNGDTSTAASPVYTYNASSVYQVTLIATTASGCSNSLVKSVLVNNKPTALFSDSLACVSNAYQFASLSQPPSGGVINQWSWSFGDNQFSALQNPLHTYSNAGSYNVKLAVTANNGCTDTTNKTLQVVSSAPAPGIAQLIFPYNLSTVSATAISFDWTDVSGAIKYSIWVATDSLFTSSQIYGNITNSNFTATLQGNQTYWWKVKAYNLCNDSSSSAQQQFTIFSPNYISGLTLWLKADSGVAYNTSSQVSQWKDISGGSNNCGQATTNFQPLIDTNIALLNYLPAVKFDGTNDFLTGNLIQGIDTSSLSIFIIAKGDATSSSSKKMIGFGTLSTGLWVYQGGAGLVYVQSQSTGMAAPFSGFPFTMFELVKQKGVQWNFYKNATQSGGAVTTNISNFTNGNYELGNATGYFRGAIAEILVFSKALSTSDRQQIESYIYNRYAPPVNLGPDITQSYSLCPVVLDASNRFVDYMWSTGDVTPTIQASSTGVYWVRATDVFGRVSSDTITVNIPYMGVNIEDTVVCHYSSVTLQPVLNSSPYSFLWNTQQTTQAISVNSAGDYVCSITDTIGCTFIADSIHVGVDSFGLTNLLPTDTDVCSGNLLPIYPGNYVVQTVLWSDNSDTTFVGVTTEDYYSVEVVNINGCIAKDTAYVNVKSTAPITSFGAPNVCFGTTIPFTDLSVPGSSDPIKTWSWNFGNFGSSTQQNPSFLFFAPGDYNVTLNITTDSGCTGTFNKVVTAAIPPTPAFSFPSIICAGTPVTLIDQSVFLFGDYIANWVWTFNGTDTITTKNAVYEFPSQGSFIVKLKAISVSGCSDTIVQTVDVFPPLTANFSAENLCIGDSTAFTDLTASLSIVDWQWNFGDFSLPSTAQNTKHKYGTPGNYPVVLTVQNAIGCIDNISKTINVVTRPTAKFGQLVTCEDQTYIPLDSSIVNNDTITSWKWTMGNSIYNGQAPAHIFADTGIYSVKLKVTTINGCVDSTQKSVSVKPRPKAQFSYTPLYGEAPVDVLFVNQSTNASSYVWAFGDGDNSTDLAPIHTYTANDTFTIQLTAVSPYGCVDSGQRSFIVAPSDLDIAVTQVSTSKTLQPDGSYLITAKARVANLGTRIITNAQFYITIGSGGVVSEEWVPVVPFESGVYDVTFTAQFVVAAENANSYVCVSAVSVNNGETEITTANNSQCSTTNEGIQLIGPTPNPMGAQGQLGIILPKAGQVVIDIVDLAGQYVVQGLQLDLPKGRSNYVLPADKMRAAEYFIRVYHNDEKIVRKFVVAK